MILSLSTKVPSREEAPPESQRYFDFFISKLGMMPNLYAVMAYHEPSLSAYLRLQQRKRLLTRLEAEVVSLIVSTMHEADYCLATHTMIARLNGLTDFQMAEICTGTVTFDNKLAALTRLVHSILSNKAKPDEALVQDFYKAGYESGHLMDVVITIAENVISNIVSNTLHLPADDLAEWVLRR